MEPAIYSPYRGHESLTAVCALFWSCVEGGLWQVSVRPIWVSMITMFFELEALLTATVGLLPAPHQSVCVYIYIYKYLYLYHVFRALRFLLDGHFEVSQTVVRGCWL